MTETNPCATLRVGDPVPDGWFDDETSPACQARHAIPSRPDLLPFACTRIEHDPTWTHVATADRPPAPGQYVGEDGVVHPADDASEIGGIVAMWRSA